MAADLYSLFAADDEPTQAEQAAALAAVLRNQEARGNLWQLSGDRVLSGPGREMVQQAAAQQQLLAQAPGARLRTALDKQRLAGQQAELDDANAPAAETYGQLARRFGVTLPGDSTNRQAKEFLAMAERAYAAEMRARELALNREAMRGAKADAAAAKEEKDIDKQVETLSKRTEAAPAMRNDLAELASGSQDDIPGVGPIAGRLPMWMLSEEGKRKRQAARGLVGTIIKERSGTAASEKEIDRIMEETGLNLANEEQFKLGRERLRQQVVDVLRAKEAGARPEAVREAHRRGLVTSDDVAAIHPEASAPVVNPGEVLMVNGKGQTVAVPADQVAKAESKKWTRVPVR